MKVRKGAAVGAALFMFAAGALAGCGSSDDESTEGGAPATTSAAPAVPTDPKQALSLAADNMKKANSKVTMTGGDGTLTGVVDPTTQSVEYSGEFSQDGDSSSIAARIIGQQVWIKMDYGPDANAMFKIDPDKWMHIDTSKMSKTAAASFRSEDPFGMDTLVKSAVTVEQSGPGVYKGTVDLTADTDGLIVDTDVLKALGDKARAVPFEITLDDSVRITKLKIDVPAAGEAKATTQTLEFSDFGNAPAVQAPAAAETVEASQDIYSMFNG